MKCAKLIFPSMFILALASSAFTQRPSSQSKRDVTVYYEDNLHHTCNPYVISDGDCITDYAGYTCMVYIENTGNYVAVWQQGGFGLTCFQPYYSYFDAP